GTQKSPPPSGPNGSQEWGASTYSGCVARLVVVLVRLLRLLRGHGLQPLQDRLHGSQASGDSSNSHCTEDSLTISQEVRALHRESDQQQASEGLHEGGDGTLGQVLPELTVPHVHFTLLGDFAFLASLARDSAPTVPVASLPV